MGGRSIAAHQLATETQEETDRTWTAIVENGGDESECGWCKDRWGISWQITPRVLTEAMRAGGPEAKRAFDAMMTMRKIDVAKIEAARRGCRASEGCATQTKAPPELNLRTLPPKITVTKHVRLTLRGRIATLWHACAREEII
jgi:hypothetical protein